MNYPRTYRTKPKITIGYVQLLRVVLFIAGTVLITRLFYVQIIRHDYYEAQALAEHIKKFEIPAIRGSIRFTDGTAGSIPVVLNETRYTIYADPQYIADSKMTASKLGPVLGGDQSELQEKLEADSRYVVLAKKMTKEQAERIEALQLKGIGQKEVSTRTYPQGNLAAQLLGFVNDDGDGQYGIEGYLDESLKGQPGQQKAVTDIRGIPLAMDESNIQKAPIPGDNITLTIDIGFQKAVEDTLKSGIERTKALSGSAIIMEADSGKIKAMANYPTYDPSQYDKLSDISVFVNPTIAHTWEPGSVIKPLLVSAAMNEGQINPGSSYFDQGYVQVDDRRITNAFNYGAQTMTVRDILNKSLNTGAVWVLKTLGGGEINLNARTKWYDYLTDSYRFSYLTGIEQSGEVKGYINPPDSGVGLTVRYSNMAFGQGFTITPIQLVAAYGAILNGGTYYQPTLLEKTEQADKVTVNEAKVVAGSVVSKSTSESIKIMIKDALEINYPWIIREGFDLGGKSGTAQVPDGQGGYKPDLYDGTYIGYIGNGGQVKYIMLVKLDEPRTGALASYEAAKVWGELCDKLINTFAFD